MFVLRGYQEEAVRLSVEFFNSKAKYRPILELPTASGKSVIIAYIAKQLTGNILILQPSKELLEQNYKKYEAVIADNPHLEPATVWSASIGVKQKSRVTFAMIGSICNDPEAWTDIDHVLIDECHRVSPQREKKNDTKKNPTMASMYVQFFRVVKAKTLGLSATPYRMKTYRDEWGGYTKINLLNRETPRFFNKFLYNVTAKTLYDGGYLSPVNYLPLPFESISLMPNSTGAEYSEASMLRAIQRNKIIERIPDILQQAFQKGQKSCLVFVKSVAEAKKLSESVPFSDYIHAKSDKRERAATIRAFKNGSIKTLFNVSVLTEGFDYPALDTIIIARPTMSLTLYAQMIGRVMRTAEGKEKGSVVDMCGNVKRFGKVEELSIEDDPKLGWVLRSDTKVLSGRRLDEALS